MTRTLGAVGRGIATRSRVAVGRFLLRRFARRGDRLRRRSRPKETMWTDEIECSRHSGSRQERRRTLPDVTPAGPAAGSSISSRSTSSTRPPRTSWLEGSTGSRTWRSSCGRAILRVAHCFPGDGRGGEGLDDQARDVRRESPGSEGCVVPAPFERGARSQLPCGVSRMRSPERGNIGIFNRSHYEEVVALPATPSGSTPNGTSERSWAALWARALR